MGGVRWDLSPLPWSRPPPTGGSPQLGAGHGAWAGPAWGRASAVQRQRWPRGCLATGQPDLKGRGRRGLALTARQSTAHSQYGGLQAASACKKLELKSQGSWVGGKGWETARRPHPQWAYYGGSGWLTKPPGHCDCQGRREWHRVNP